MCGRITLFIGPDSDTPRLLRTIPHIQIAVPSEIQRPALRRTLDDWLDADQRDCALALWKKTTSMAQVTSGTVMVSCPDGN